MAALTKLWQLLAPDQRGAASGLLGLMLIGMLLETLGLGLVIPALAVVTQGDVTLRYSALAPLLDALGNPSRERLIATGMVTLVCVYAIKALFLAYLAFNQARFVYRFQAALSQRLFAGYLRQPYSFHLQRNSAELIRNMIGQVADVTQVSQLSLTLIAECMVMIGISVLLFAVEPLGALAVICGIGVAGWAFNRITRNRSMRWGHERQLHERQRIQRLQEGLGGAKDIKLLGREDGFIARYQLHNAGSARVSERQVTLQALPRLWLEFLAVTGLAVLVLIMLGQGREPETLLPTVGLFAAAAFRVMPSISRVLSAIQSVRFSLPAIDSLRGEFALLNTTNVHDRETSPPFSRALTLEHVGFRYAEAVSAALSDVSLTIDRGTSVGFIGTTGAGKSTLVDIILGLLSPGTGVVRVDGEDIQRRLRGWQSQIGYVPQSIYLADDTLRRNVAFGLPDRDIDEAAVSRAIRAAQLEGFVDELPLGLDSMVGERGVRLSGGQRQRIGIARALYHNPSVLVLDEATSSLDVATERGVMSAVRALRGEKTLIIVAHRLSTVEHCDRIFRLERGTIVEQGNVSVMLTGAASRMN